MCIIIYTPNGYIPKKHLKNSLAYNEDGWGIMWPENGVLQIATGMEYNEFWKEWKWIGKLSVPKVFHARIGTHGLKNLDNCHPFAIPGHGQLAVAHNGIISNHADATNNKSDTRNFIEDVLTKLPIGFLQHDGVLEMMSDYIGHSKLVFMDGDGNTHIINAEFGCWENKRWYSNHSHKWQKSYLRSTTYYDTAKPIVFQPRAASAVQHVKQENFPVFKEDEIASTSRQYRQHGSYDDYDKASDEEWQKMVEGRLENNDRHNSCGIGIPSAVLGNQLSSEPKTGLATMEDIARGRKNELRKLERVIRERYPEYSPGAVQWRVENVGQYPCTLPDPAEKYNGYFDM